MKSTLHKGKDGVVMSAEEWRREQETRYVLQNASLMRQIAAGMVTHANRTGYRPSAKEFDEILDA